MLGTLAATVLSFGSCFAFKEPVIENPSPDAVAIIAAYGGLKAYCDEGVTQRSGRAPERFSRCFSRDGRYLERFEGSPPSTKLARWGDETMHRVWEGTAFAPLRLTKRYGENPRCMPFNYAVGADFESRALDGVFGELGVPNRIAALNALSRFHPAGIDGPPGIVVFERLGEIEGSEVSRELIYVRRSDKLIMEYQRFSRGSVVYSTKLTMATGNPTLAQEQLTFDVPLMNLTFGQLAGIAWLLLFFGAPIYVVVRLLRHPTPGARRVVGGAWIVAWIATAVSTVLFFLSGAWYQEHTSLGMNIVTVAIMVALYLVLPISMIVFARLKLAR